MTARPQPTLPLGYRAAIARWSDAPLSTSYPSHSSEYSASLFGSSSAAPSVPRSRPSHRRSRHVSSLSSSSGTSHTPPGALPRRIHLISSYSTPPSSVGPSHKKCRSSTTSLQAAALAPAVLSFIPVNRLPPRKRLRGSPDVSYQDATIEATAEPTISPVHHRLMVEERLDKQREMIGRMHNHLLGMPLSRIEEIEEELQTLKAKTVRTRLTEMRHQVRDTAEQLQQC
ncbi:hypothetical protein Tco_1368923 [Tanacetum coccineum]